MARAEQRLRCRIGQSWKQTSEDGLQVGDMSPLQTRNFANLNNVNYFRLGESCGLQSLHVLVGGLTRAKSEHPCILRHGRLSESQSFLQKQKRRAMSLKWIWLTAWCIVESKSKRNHKTARFFITIQLMPSMSLFPFLVSFPFHILFLLLLRTSRATICTIVTNTYLSWTMSFLLFRKAIRVPSFSNPHCP